LSSPGIETKEVFLPIGQLSAKLQVTNDLSLAAQYLLEWRATRMPAAGTFLGPADMIPQSIDRFPNFGFPAVPAVKPGHRGNWGISARWNLPESGTLGFYYRKFDDYNGWINVPTAGPNNFPSAVRLVYPKDIQLFGLSYATAGPWGASMGAEVSYRKNDALALNDTFTLAGEQGPRGNTWHALVNSVWLLGTTPFWEAGSLVAELAYSRLGKVTSHPELFKGEGYPSCANQDRSTGCATRGVWSVSVALSPSWLQVAPGLDIEMHDLHLTRPHRRIKRVGLEQQAGIVVRQLRSRQIDASVVIGRQGELHFGKRLRGFVHDRLLTAHFHPATLGINVDRVFDVRNARLLLLFEFLVSFLVIRQQSVLIVFASDRIEDFGVVVNPCPGCDERDEAKDSDSAQRPLTNRLRVSPTSRLISFGGPYWVVSFRKSSALPKASLLTSGFISRVSKNTPWPVPCD